MSIHHKMGMSRWTPWSVCPKYDSIPYSTSASIGTAQHDKLARLLNSDDTLELDDTEMIDRAVRWAGAVISGDAQGETLYTEEMVEIGEGISKDLAGIYGTVDAFFIQHTEGDGKVIHIYDFKSMGRGMGCDLFPQLKGYALGVASLLGVTEMNTKVVLHVLLEQSQGLISTVHEDHCRGSDNDPTPHPSLEAASMGDVLKQYASHNRVCNHAAKKQPCDSLCLLSSPK